MAQQDEVQIKRISKQETMYTIESNSQAEGLMDNIMNQFLNKGKKKNK